MDDHDLLRQYAQNHSQDAFRELVEKHLSLVYSTARRMVSDSHLAEEVAQSTFTTLAQKADSIRPPQVVAGWLYGTARNLALHAIRTNQRRREREQLAVAMQALDSNSDSGRINEHLEPAMAELDSSDRDALLLRFFEDRNLSDVGRQLGVSEDAARMRVNRALERLRTIFQRKGVAVSSVVLASSITAATASAVPAGLAITVTTAALTATTTTALITHTAITTMSWINIKSAAVIVAAAALTGTGTYFVQQKKINQLHADQQTLVADYDKLKADRGTALASSQLKDEELDRLRKDVKDLPRLRNEIAQPRRQKETDKQSLAQQTKPVTNNSTTLDSPAPGSGRYITVDELAFVGYATPETGLHSMNWAMMKGSYEQVTNSLSPQMLEGEQKDPKARKQFETGQQKMGSLFRECRF